MATLRIEHPITDYDVWRAAFDRFESARTGAGVQSFTIRRPVDEPGYLLLDLEFPSVDAASSFANFLHAKVWSSPEASPGLAGAPQTRVLEVMPGQ